MGGRRADYRPHRDRPADLDARRDRGVCVMFTPDQQAILEGKLDKSAVKPRKGANGRTVSYVEGWYVVDMANEVFGFGNWDAETVEMKREHEPVQIPPTEEHPKGGIVVTYSAKVRVTVYS